MAKKDIDKLAEQLSQSTPRQPIIPDSEMLSAGCTLLNLAFSGRPNVGIPCGNYVFIFGGSGSTKTWSGFTWFAEASRNKHFNDHRFVFDNAENGALWDTERFFGASVYERLEQPYKNVRGSGSVEEFYYHLAINCEKGPCIYLLDSMDALNPDVANEIWEAKLEKYQTGKGKVAGSMGMDKGKVNSQNINRMVMDLYKSRSILIIIGQYRSKPGGYPGQKAVSGGLALRFYAHIRASLEAKESITKTYLKKERNVGSRIQVDVEKNRVCGWEDRISLEFLKNYGVDDIGTSVQWLLDEFYWTTPERRKKAAYDDDEVAKLFAAPEFEFEGKKEKLIELIQDKSLEWELQQLVAKVWRGIIDGATPNRKLKYR